MRDDGRKTASCQHTGVEKHGGIARQNERRAESSGTLQVQKFRNAMFAHAKNM